MNRATNTVMGGDPFCDIFRGTYDLHQYWNLTDPDYCTSVMKSAYDGGCRSYELSFPSVVEMFLKLESQVGESLTGYANPTYIQGIELNGRPLQFCRSRILKTFAEREGFFNEEHRDLLRTKWREDTCMVFGYDPETTPLSDQEIRAIRLNEDAYLKRLNGLGACSRVLVGGTDADWLFTLGRGDIIEQMCSIVRSLGKAPYLLTHYTSTVLPKADAASLPVDGYFAVLNKSWAWLDHDAAVKAVRNASRPVTAFMAFACGGLTGGMQEAADWLKEECGVSGIMFGTTKRTNAFKTASMLTGMFDKT